MKKKKMGYWLEDFLEEEVPLPSSSSSALLTSNLSKSDQLLTTHRSPLT